jgi:hypothetical protein
VEKWGKMFIMHKPEQLLNSPTRKGAGSENSRLIYNPLPVLREYIINSQVYLTHQKLSHLTPAGALVQRALSLHVTLGQSRDLRGHLSKHSGRTADKNLRTRDCKGATSVLVSTEDIHFSTTTRKNC